MPTSIRKVLAILSGLIAVTAFAGGGALIVGSVMPASSGGIVPDAQFLSGSPFPSYLIPGAILALVIGGSQATASIALFRNARSAGLITAVAAFGLLIWIFVQMIFIPFSVLQAVYFAAGAAELGLLLLGLGLIAPPAHGRFERPHP
jgi:hypothetical protein